MNSKDTERLKDFLEKVDNTGSKITSPVVFSIGYSAPKRLYAKSSLSDAKKERYCIERDFWSSNNKVSAAASKEGGPNSNNSLDYLLEEEKVKEGLIEEDALTSFMEEAGYDGIDYFTNTKKLNVKTATNSGAFSDKGIITKQRMKELRKELQTNEGFIWHGIISLQDCYNAKFESQKDAIAFINKFFPKLFKDNNRDFSNIQIIASLHCNTENRHIHFLAYEKNVESWHASSHTQGIFTPESLEAFRNNSSDYISEWSSHYAIARAELLKQFKTLTTEQKNSKLYNIIQDLSKELPKEGRLSYNSSNIGNEGRKKIDLARDEIIELFPELKDKRQEALGLILSNTREIDGKKVLDKKYKGLLKDLNERLGNVVIGIVKNFNFNSNTNLFKKDYFSNTNTTPKRITKSIKDNPTVFLKSAKQKRKDGIIKFTNGAFSSAINNYIKDHFSRSLEEIEFEILLRERKKKNAD
ncbi:MAG: relaxase MobL [Acholeplasmatales bacterium]|jgi:hypothetical protein|nr:relaxase MobL [Acholeplasmatales bacterium]